MIAADTNIWVAHLSGAIDPDIKQLHLLLRQKAVGMIPVVLAELLTHPTIAAHTENHLLALPLFELPDGHWERAGRLRRALFALGYKPKLMDTLIAQTCLDHKLPLLTRDTGFTLFAEHAGLQLL